MKIIYNIPTKIHRRLTAPPGPAEAKAHRVERQVNSETMPLAVITCAAEKPGLDHFSEAKVIVGVNCDKLVLLTFQAIVIDGPEGKWPPRVTITGVESVRQHTRSRPGNT